MTSDEIKAMFQANAALKHCQPNDPQLPILEEATQQLTRKYIAECISSQKPVEQSGKMSLQEAFDVIVKTCQSATSLELEHHPNGVTDDQIQTLASVRKMALDRIAEEIASNS